MKKLTYFGIAACALTLASCSNDDMPFENNQSNAGSFSIKATILKESTRVTAEAGDNNKYLLRWQEGDAIGVHNGQMNKLELTDGYGTGSATFSGNISGEGTITTAVYPHSANNKYENDSWTINLPDSYSYAGAYTGNINSPMIGNVSEVENEGLSLNFEHLAAVIRFEINSLPAGANKVVLTTAGKTITGDFTVTQDGDKSQINVTDGNTNNSVAISFSNSESAASEQSSVFFFPVPVGEYTSIKLDIMQDEAILNSFEKTGTFTLNRADMGLYPVISVGGEVEDLQNACKNGGTFKLVKDLTVEQLTIEKDLKLNLGSYTLKSKQITVASGTLTIEGEESGAIDATEYTTDSNNNPGLICVNGQDAKVIVNSGKLVTKYGTCIYQIQGDVEIKGGNIESKYFAVANNNVKTTANGKITISGGTLKSSEDWAVYIAKQTTVEISGESTNISGKQGCVGINEGEVTVTGGSFSSECENNTTVKSDGTNNLYGGIFAAAASYGSVKLSVSAGTFNGKNAIVTSYQTPTSPNTRTITVTGGTWQDPEVLNFAGDNANITVSMATDKEIKKAIEVTKGTTTVDFNGHTLSNKTDLGTGTTPDTHAFLISGEGTKVTFNDSGANGGITINANASDKDGYRHAMIISENAKVIIKGGKYYNTQKVNAQLDLIQVGKGSSDDKASLEVNGGHFESGCYSTYNNKTPRYWILNIKNECKNCKISVKGGEFINWNPAKPDMDDNDSYLATGYKVTVTGDNVEDDYASKTYVEAVANDSQTTRKLTYTVSAE